MELFVNGKQRESVFPDLMEVSRSKSRFTYAQFCMVIWQMSHKNLHFGDFKILYAPELRLLYKKKLV